MAGPGPRARSSRPRRPTVHGDGGGAADRRDRHRHQGARSCATSSRAAREVDAAPVHARPPRSCSPTDPDAFFLANGPGDPAALGYVVETVRELVGKQAGVGHLPRPPAALPAVGLETFKLPFGHRGANHPVKDLRRAGSRSPRRTTASRSLGPDGGAAIDADEPVRWETDFGAAELTPRQPLRPHRRGPRAARRARRRPSSTTPRPGPGPHDSLYLFDRFLERIEAA